MRVNEDHNDHDFVDHEDHVDHVDHVDYDDDLFESDNYVDAANKVSSGDFSQSLWPALPLSLHMDTARGD